MLGRHAPAARARAVDPPDGEHLLFVALPGGPAGFDMFVGSLMSRTVKRLLTAQSPGPWRVSSRAPDGRRAAGFNGSDLWLVDLKRSVPMRFATSTSNSPTSVWSPDGRSFPEPGHKVRVSPGGGQFPRWVNGGRTLRYSNGDAVVTIPRTAARRKPATGWDGEVTSLGVRRTRKFVLVH